MNKLIKYLTDKLVAYCEKRGKVFKITGGPNGETVYLVRYIAYSGMLGCVYIHRFMRSDADDPHDHPWDFWTYVISGGYTEIRYDRSSPVVGMEKGDFVFSSLWTRTENKRKPGSFAKIRANDIHQVVVDKSRNMDEIEDAPYTICYMKPRIREWGFWSLEDKGKKFVDWREYLSITPYDPRIEGSE